MKKNCDLITNSAFQKECITGVVSGLGGRYGGDPSRMIAFCAKVDIDHKRTCYEMMGNTMRSWAEDDQIWQQGCQQIGEEPFVSWCRGPAAN